MISQDYIFALVGGIIIGFSAWLFLRLSGRILGVSGIVGGLVTPKPHGVAWRLAFLLGLLLVGAATARVAPQLIAGPRHGSMRLLIIAGLLVGIGTTVGGGCTSGHGVCGVGRLSPRSILATVTFIVSGVATVFLLRWLQVIA